jgi:hypothetical protein
MQAFMKQQVYHERYNSYLVYINHASRTSTY